RRNCRRTPHRRADPLAPVGPAHRRGAGAALPGGPRLESAHRRWPKRSRQSSPRATWSGPSETDSTVRRQMRLLVARCEVLYTGRLTARLPEAVRLLMFKADGSFLVHDDAGGFRPLNWMTPPTVIEEEGDVIVVRKRAGKSEDRLEVRLVDVLSDVEHALDATPLENDGVERHLQ